MYRPAKWLGLALAPFAGLLYAGTCHAEESGMISGGYIHSFVWGHSPAAGNGIELSYIYYADRRQIEGLGGFLQLQSYGDHGRHAIGFQVNEGPFGLELGYARRGSDGEHDVTHGVHVGAFASLGVPLISFRVVPAFASGEDSHGTEIALTLGIKLFANLHGGMVSLFDMPHGRPLRVAGHAVPRSDLTSSAHTHCVDEHCVNEHCVNEHCSDQHSVHEHWLDAVRAEHESVAAFAGLTRDLLALGAPRHLIQASIAAARDEQRHVVLCLAALAELSSAASAGRARPDEPADARPAQAAPTHAAPIAACLLPAAHQATSLELLISSSLIDGCLGEHFSARQAGYAAQHMTNPRTARGLETIAEDEERHAELGWAVLEWCWELEPVVTERILTQALLSLPELSPEAHSGLVDSMAQAALFSTARLSVLERGSALLASMAAQHRARLAA